MKMIHQILKQLFQTLKLKCMMTLFLTILRKILVQFEIQLIMILIIIIFMAFIFEIKIQN